MTDDYMEDVSEMTGEELNEPTELWITTLVEQGVSMQVHPDFLPEDTTLEEHVEEEIKENYVGQIAAEIADGIHSGDIQIESVERENL